MSVRDRACQADHPDRAHGPTDARTRSRTAPSTRRDRSRVRCPPSAAARKGTPCAHSSSESRVSRQRCGARRWSASASLHEYLGTNEWFVVGFSPRKAALTIFGIHNGYTAPDPLLLAELGRRTTGKSCVYVKRLDQIDQNDLEQLVRKASTERRPRRSADESPRALFTLARLPQGLGAYALSWAYAPRNPFVELGGIEPPWSRPEVLVRGRPPSSSSAF